MKILFFDPQSMSRPNASQSFAQHNQVRAAKQPPPLSQSSLCMGLIHCIFLFLLSSVTCPAPLYGGNPFPRYPLIENNVRFWENIYSRYSTSQAVIHDSDNLAIIYEVLPIFNHRLPGSSKINRPILKGIKKKYSTILENLAKGNKPQTKEEQRVASLFAHADRKRLQKASESVRAQVGQKDRFHEGVIRSGAYMAEIKKIFKKEGLPQDLAYLPHVESSFNLRAYSKFGASGIWQFTRATGKQFLTIDYAIDERQDPILASQAAAKFLKKNYTLLGSWPLALTAYNYGPAGMQRAQKAHSTYENIFRHYEQGHFKFASRNFYSEFLAAVKVAKKLEKSPAIQLDKPQITVDFKLPAYVAVEDLCSHFNITTRDIGKYNPAIRKPVLQGKKYIPKGFVLKLPSSSRNKKLLAAIPGHIYHKKQKPTKFYRVRSGDTAGEIARAHGISLKSLRRTNNLSRDATIFVGQNLRIPDKGHKRTTTAAIRASGRKKTKSALATEGSASTLPLLSDSKKSKPPWKNIQKSRSVVLGDIGIRKLPGEKHVPLATIIIQPEESLELLAGWLKVAPSTLRKLNKLPPSSLIHPDEELHIDLSKVSPQEFEEKRFDYHLETEEDFFNSYEVVGVETYTVKRGDTVWELCKTKFDLPLWLLKKYNSTLDFKALRSSQQLTIPIVKTI